MVHNLNNIVIIVDVQMTIIPLQPRLLSISGRMHLAIRHSMALNPSGRAISGFPT